MRCWNCVRISEDGQISVIYYFPRLRGMLSFSFIHFFLFSCKSPWDRHLLGKLSGQNKNVIIAACVGSPGCPLEADLQHPGCQPVLWDHSVGPETPRKGDAVRGLDKDCGNMGAGVSVWLEAGWKGPCWESVSRKDRVTSLSPVSRRGYLWPKYLKWRCLESQKVHVGNVLSRWKPPSEAGGGEVVHVSLATYWFSKGPWASRNSSS